MDSNSRLERHEWEFFGECFVRLKDRCVYLQKWVTDAKILQGGSNFPRNIFDPSALHEEVLP